MLSSTSELVDKKSKLGARTASIDEAPSTLVNIFVNLQKVPRGKTLVQLFIS